jgi:hypothetical protein
LLTLQTGFEMNLEYRSLFGAMPAWQWDESRPQSL